MIKDRAIVKFIESQPWAIVPESLEVIKSIVADHMAGRNVVLGQEDEPKFARHPQHHNLAVIPVQGTIKKKNYGLAALSGARTTVDIANDVKNALEDSSVDGIILDVDSPGGTVAGTKELASFIADANKQKPIVSYANGTMASAAYWIGCAASKIVAYDTAQVGSIGVIMSHEDWSKAEEQVGVKVTHVFAGKYKAYGNSNEPLTEDSKAYLQEKVDAYYTLFVNDVAANRSIEVSDALKMADGKVFIGEQAKQIGLVDAVGGIEVATDILLGLIESKKLQDGGKKQMAEEKGATISAEQFAELQAQLVKAQTDAADALAKLAKREDEIAAEKKKEAVIGALKASKNEENAELVALGMALDEKAFGVVVATLDASAAKVKELASKLTIETGEVDGKKEDAAAPTTIDAAVALISKRDNLEDVEEATDKAAAEFPELFKKLGGK